MTKHKPLKISLIVLASLILGGCNLATQLGNSAVSDQKPQAVITASPNPSVDADLVAIPPTGDDNDTTTLEDDINNTIILEEDYADLE